MTTQLLISITIICIIVLIVSSINNVYNNPPNILNHDLPFNTLVVCTDNDSEYWDIGLYIGNSSVSLGFYKKNGRLIENRYKIIVPYDKFNFKEMTYDEKDNYGVKNKKKKR